MTSPNTAAPNGSSATGAPANGSRPIDGMSPIDGTPPFDGTGRCTVERRTLSPVAPLAAYRALRDAFGAEHAFLLESVGGPATDNRVSLAGLAGRAEVTVTRGVVRVSGQPDLREALERILDASGTVETVDGQRRLVDDDALFRLPQALGAALDPGDEASREDLALSLLSVFGYDAARYVEKLPRTIADLPDAPPDAVFGIVDALVTLDPAGARLAVVAPSAWSGIDGEAVARTLEAAACLPLGGDAPQVPEPDEVTDDITREDYLPRGERCLEHIRIGDIYQVQLGHSLTVRTQATPLAVYERLRERNPSPYMALLPAAGHTIVCASPELFVRVEGGRAVMRPIAGTARRGGDEEATKAELLANPKERAEHIMLVDLCRNDFGRISRPGSLDVETLMTIETYSHVFHIVSQVSCELADDADAYDVVRASFPAGTVSGAPKVRAMEIIEDLETSRRGFYAGAFGLIGTDAREALLGLAIRMAVHRDGAFVLRASAGFVADSDPEAEWNETLSKLASTYWAVAGKEIR